MARRADVRRLLGTVFLAASVLMLVLGLTVFEGRLAGDAFVFYWSLCFLVTGLAAITALLDARAVRRQAREAHRELLERTLREVEAERENRNDRSEESPG